MKWNKSFLIVLLAICISIFGIYNQAQAEEIANGTCGDSATWTLDSEGTLTINGEGAIDSNWIDYIYQIKTVILEGNITEIKENTFYNAFNLTSITIPETVTVIGEDAFYNVPLIHNLSEAEGSPWAADEVHEYAEAECPTCAENEEEGTTEEPAPEDGTTEEPAPEDGTTEEPAPEHEHSYTKKFVWADDYSSCNAEFACEKCEEVQTVECEVTSETDGVICEENVTVTYTASCEFEDVKYVETKEVEISAGHAYGEGPEWDWEEDYSKATFILICERCESKSVVECETTSSTTEATCTVDGKTVYTASCIHEGKRYSDTKEIIHPAPGHVFDSSPVWTWSDDCKEATATFKCSVCKEDEVKEATVTEYPETATCTEAGDVMYVATCTMDKTQYSYSKTITVDSLGHKYGEPEFVWDGDDAGQASLTCEREGCGHVEVTEGTITTATTKPTCTENGKIILTGTCEVDGETYTTTKEEELLATGHTFGDWVVVEEATATTSGLEERTCTACGTSETRVINIENPFVDVAEGSYYYDAVLWAYENNITTGTDATHFSPDRACSRAEIVTFLWRANGCPKPETQENPFVDIKEGSYYYDAVLWAYEKNITTGTDATHFSPDVTCTRDQIVTFLWRAEGSPEPTIENPFADIKEGTYYYDAVLWAYENNITTGTDSTHFEPSRTCTRAQVVTFLYRTYEEE